MAQKAAVRETNCALDKGLATGPVLIKTKIPSFCIYLNRKGSSTPNNLLRRVKTIWASCMF